MSKESRKSIHILCDQIGLHHKSVDSPVITIHRDLHIYRPSTWLWEYTVRNPYSKSEEELERNRERNQQREDEKLRRITCDECGKNALDCEMYSFFYFHAFCCADCLETAVDDAGYPLSDHKNYPVY